MRRELKKEIRRIGRHFKGTVSSSHSSLLSPFLPSFFSYSHFPAFPSQLVPSLVLIAFCHMCWVLYSPSPQLFISLPPPILTPDLLLSLRFFLTYIFISSANYALLDGQLIHCQGNIFGPIQCEIFLLPHVPFLLC